MLPCPYVLLGSFRNIHMREKIAYSIKEIAQSPLAEKQALFLATYTGIEKSQIEKMSPEQGKKVFLGLWKQLDLTASLHGEQTKDILKDTLGTYFMQPVADIEKLTEDINSLLVFGDKRALAGTGVEYLHKRLSHFWRILGWEELRQLETAEDSIKHPPGTIEPIVRSTGNLIRTLDLLGERWEEAGIGPNLVYPNEKQIARREVNGAHSTSRLQTPHTNTLAVITKRNEEFPTEDARSDFKKKGLLLEKLLDRYPVEFAYAIFDYYAFTQGWDKKGYNVAFLQEYVLEGERRIKGIFNGKAVVLSGHQEDGKVRQEMIAASVTDKVVGSSGHSDFTMFDRPISDSDVITVIHGGTAGAINGYPEIITTFNVNPYTQLRDGINKFAKAIGKSKYEKPVNVLHMGEVNEYKPIIIDSNTLEQSLTEIISYAHQHGIRSINIEAGHIHADTTPTKRQKKGIQIGSFLASNLEKVNLELSKSTMIDEDHVPNVIAHGEYIDLMRKEGYSLDEVIYESSPVVREISVAAINTLVQKYPNNISKEGNAIVLNIPNTELEVELIKDISLDPFELGCVIFDVGLTLYKTYPELSKLYSNESGKNVHEGMMQIYEHNVSTRNRFQAARARFPNKTAGIDDLKTSSALPSIEARGAAIINVLEGFYDQQQDKLQWVLKMLDLPITLIDVSFSQQGLKTVIH